MLLIAPQLVATLFIDFLFSPPRAISGERTSLFFSLLCSGSSKHDRRQSRETGEGGKTEASENGIRNGERNENRASTLEKRRGGEQQEVALASKVAVSDSKQSTRTKERNENRASTQEKRRGGEQQEVALASKVAVSDSKQ